MIVGGEAYSTPISCTRMPLLEQNVAGSAEAAITSACRDSTQKPCCRFHATGASARSRA